MNFQTMLDTHFPKALRQQEFVDSTYQALEALGFNRDNSIACVSVCRDEITRPLVDAIQKAWGEAFNLSSLAGLVFAGTTAFRAAHHHSPRENERERYLHFGFSHIGIGPQGELGWVRRAGRYEPSGACGALITFQRELASGEVPVELDDDDLELSLLRRRLARRLEVGQKPDLVTLTRCAYEAIVEDLERMTDLTVDPSKADYALVTGIQVHAEGGKDHIWPGTRYAWIDGKVHLLGIS